MDPQKTPSPPPPPPPKSIGATPSGFKDQHPSKKPATVTQQLTKSVDFLDFRQNYVCGCHLSAYIKNDLSINPLPRIN